MKQLVKETIEKNLGLWMGIILEYVFILNNLYAGLAFLFVWYITAPFITCYLLKEWRDDDSWFSLILAISHLSIFSFFSVVLLKVCF